MSPMFVEYFDYFCHKWPLITIWCQHDAVSIFVEIPNRYRIARLCVFSEVMNGLPWSLYSLLRCAELCCNGLWLLQCICQSGHLCSMHTLINGCIRLSRNLQRLMCTPVYVALCAERMDLMALALFPEWLSHTVCNCREIITVNGTMIVLNNPHTLLT